MCEITRTMTTFADLGLRPEINQALEKLGFESPTSIQEQAIPHILNSKQDLIALAQTGTGKTGAFSLPVLSLIDGTKKHTQALVLCPTRELCLQISKDIKGFLAFTPDIKVAAIYGGDSYTTQMNALRAGPQIIVGTPGRMLDMINRKALKLESISWLILDEADEMLKMGFKEELDSILKTSPKDKQTLLFSATMDKTVERIARDYMHNIKEISTSTKNSGSATIKHEYYFVQARDKYETLKRVLDVNPDIYGIIFCNTRLETQQITAKLAAEHYTAAAISGELSQPQREQVMLQFRNKQIKLLVATDVAARGIDIKELSHVIHYGFPTKVEYYTHRSGRTGRAGSTGVSISIIHSRESYMLKMIASRTNVKFESKKIPTANEICTAQLLNLIERITETKTDSTDLAPYMPLIEEKLAHLTREELVHHLVAVEMSRFINFYKNLPDVHTPIMREPTGFIRNESGRPAPYAKEGMARLQFNIGRKQGFSVPKLFGLINSETGTKGIQVGDIKIENDFSIIEVDKNRATKFISTLRGIRVDGIPLDIRSAVESGGSSPATSARPRSSGSRPASAPYAKRVSPKMFKKRY